MKMALLTAAALFATPLIAQTTPMATPAPTDQSATTTTTDPSATPTQSTAPTTTPPATDPSMATGSAPMAQGQAMPAGGDGATPAPAPMADGKVPYCRPGQFTGCREHSNAAGARVHHKRKK